MVSLMCWFYCAWRCQKTAGCISLLSREVQAGDINLEAVSNKVEFKAMELNELIRERLDSRNVYLIKSRIRQWVPVTYSQLTVCNQNYQNVYTFIFLYEFLRCKGQKYSLMNSTWDPRQQFIYIKLAFLVNKIKNQECEWAKTQCFIYYYSFVELKLSFGAWRSFVGRPAPQNQVYQKHRPCQGSLSTSVCTG